MRGRKSHLVVTLSPEERQILEHRLRCTTTPLGAARRCRAILAVADGLPFVAAARQAGLTEKHLRKWDHRFLARRLDGLQDRPGRGHKPGVSPRGGDARRQAGL